MMNKDKALELRLLGKSYQEIADVAGISKQRVHQLLTGYRSPTYRAYNKAAKKRFSQTEKGKEHHRKAQAQLRAKAKVLVLTHYGNGKCVCKMCGYDNVKALSIDHIEACGNHHKRVNRIKSGNYFYRWLLKQNLPVGYQTLCMNCQWIKRYDNNECHRI